MKKNSIEVDTEMIKLVGVDVAVCYGLLKDKFGSSNIIKRPVQLIVDTLGITIPTARKIINTLIEKDLIEKKEYIDRQGFTYRFL